MAHPDQPKQLKLRIPNDLRRRVERAARQHGTSINNEIRVQLVQSFEVESLRSINEVADDLDLNWHLYGERFLSLELGDNILTALEARDFDKARSLASALRKSQEIAARQRTEKMIASDKSR